ncbi:MAG: hypothetical protein U5J97_12350 [Trueperaceae bacterium]|nr:hypothetical protein [Trueperaceae bacterium]
MLDLIPQFSPAPAAAELLARSLPRALAAWGERYDAIVIDTPPVGSVADPLNIAPYCTGTLLVVDRQKTDRRMLARTVELLARASVRVLGVAVNRDTDSASRNLYGYGAEVSPRGRRNSMATVRVSDGRGPSRSR